MRNECRLAVLIGMAIVCCAAGSALPARAQDAKQSGNELHVLFTSDLHSQLLPQRVSGSSGHNGTIGGYARIVGLIRDIRDQKGADATLVVDAGDFSMGTVFHTLFRSESLELRLMGDMGYEVTTLGNHDFDFHPDGLARALMAASASTDHPPRIVSANVVFSPSDMRDRSLQEAFRQYPVPPYLVLQKAGFRIGVFGILGKDAQIDAPFARPVTFSDPIIAARGIVQQLKHREKVDVIVCLSHSGISANPSHSEDERLAREVPEIDIIISGHTHSVLPEPIRIGETILGAAGSYGQYLGTMTVSLSPRQRPGLIRYALLPVNGQAGDGDPLIESKIRSFEDLVNQEFLSAYGMHFGQILSESPEDFPSLASTYEHPGETGLGDLITDAFRNAVHRAEGKDEPFVHIAIQPLGNIRANLLRGPVRVEDVFQVLSLGIGPDGMPGYPLITVYLNGTEIRRLLEVETTVSGLKRAAHLQVSGVRFQYNPHRLPFDRVTQIDIEGPGGTWEAPVADRLYRVALNSYTAQMVGYVSNVSHGLLSMTPKHADGSPMKDWKEGIVRDHSGGSPSEIKEWLAMARYLKHFPDLDGNGVADIPVRYLKPEGRIRVEPSWNPWLLIAPAGPVTMAAICFLAAFIAIAAFVYGFFRRKARSRHQMIAGTDFKHIRTASQHQPTSITRHGNNGNPR